MVQLVMSIREAMEATTLGKTKVYELIGEGRLTKIKVGRRTLVTIESVRRLLNPDWPIEAGSGHVCAGLDSPSGSSGRAPQSR